MKVLNFFRDLLLFLFFCAITYYLPGLLNFFADMHTLSIVGILGAPSIFIAVVTLYTLFSSKRIPSIIFLVLLTIYLTVAYVQSFLIADLFFRIIFAISVLMGLIRTYHCFSVIIASLRGELE